MSTGGPLSPFWSGSEYVRSSETIHRVQLIVRTGKVDPYRTLSNPIQPGGVGGTSALGGFPEADPELFR